MIAWARMALAAAALATSLPVLAADGRVVDLHAEVGVPTGSATVAKPWDIDFTLPPAMAGGAPVIKRVSITNLPAIMAGETLRQARVRKARTIAAEINTQIGKGTAKVTFDKDKNPILNVKGLYEIPPSKPGKKDGTPAIVQKTNPTNEFGDGAKLVPGTPLPGSSGSPGGSSSQSGSLTPAAGSSTSQFASGLDPLGSASVVSLGIDTLYVASITPTPGQSLFDILGVLNDDLQLHGVPVFFDTSDLGLTVVGTSADNGYIVFADTDTGLALDFALNGAVPEPATWALMIAGFGVVGAALRRRSTAAA